ncbi:hypothetical protein QQY66_37560 [Streptomyces sp. DG2A-72]|uniref:hypothetical protein n=1 Tax=Streptomyces sp. DG2A-72 TaxID=3051386 RepID=UPI00265BCBDD|nr:hypothetical protein [Streptomyces sp. DG2A-72]MDO0937149.1 hypothetical protein [Streptomyces sp. DG2A-72]
MGHLADRGTWVASEDGDPFEVDAVWACRESLGVDRGPWVLEKAPVISVAGVLSDASPDDARRLARLLLEAADEGERRWAAAVSAREHPDWFTPFTSQ